MSQWALFFVVGIAVHAWYAVFTHSIHFFFLSQVCSTMRTRQGCCEVFLFSCVDSLALLCQSRTAEMVRAPQWPINRDGMGRVWWQFQLKAWDCHQHHQDIFKSMLGNLQYHLPLLKSIHMGSAMLCVALSLMTSGLECFQPSPSLW